MTQPIYASVYDYTKYTGEQVPEAERASLSVRLRRASRVVDEMLVGAVYTTLDDDSPIETDVRDLLAEATALQAQYFEETGDMTGAGLSMAGGSIGSVTLPNLASGSARVNTQTGRWSPEVLLLVRQSPLLRWEHYH